MTAAAMIVTPANQHLQSPGPSRHDSTPWRGIAMRETRCGDLFLSAIALATAVIFWRPL